MPFPPPTQGYEEQHISGTALDYLLPRPTIKAIQSPNDLSIAGITEGDVITVEPHQPPKNGSIAIIERDGDQHVVKLHWYKQRWYAETDTHKGVITENINYIALVRTVIKSQI
ncbi:hypothetical protein ACN08N_23610 [Photobacterium leiognathi subsp. mandapamensis]|uniref:hypothetical protein n=1 Tax=Photobacterium leiognathi TaxID=553611 RepID=UPI003AF38E18